MTYIKPTYEEYCNATRFAKFRYKFGIYVQLISAILLIYLLFFTITNIEEMKANPALYAEKKLGVICSHPMNIQLITQQSSGEIKYDSIGNITNIKER
jgi:hypothetical protein